MSFGCKCSCSSARRVSNFNSNVPLGVIYPHIKFERDIFRVRALMSSGSTGGLGGGGDTKTIISPNTLFGDIITSSLLCNAKLPKMPNSNLTPFCAYWFRSLV